MTHTKIGVLSFLFLLLCVFGSCRQRPPRNRLDENHFPRMVLWAWERPEDLKSLDTNRFAVALLAQTLILKGDEVIFKPRHQPLDVPPEAKLIAVTRIESQKATGEQAALTDQQRQRLATLILKTSQFSGVVGIQIDFDAALSERSFYRALLQDLRTKLPDNAALSITSLASFCVGDRWLDGLPVDEAVPMVFRMGADDRTIKNFLAGGDDFREPLCQRSYGIAIDEPLNLKFKPDRRIYVFNEHPWTASDIASLNQAIVK